MSQRSRDEKLAAAKKKLKKFQENTSKVKKKEENSLNDALQNQKLRFLYFLKYNYYGINSFINFVPQYSNSFLDYSSNEKEECKQIKNITSQNQCNSTDVGLFLEEPTATTESLKHISRHLNGIISCSNSSIDRESQQEHLNTIRDLEKRNVELANLNSQKAEQMEILNTKITNLNENNERMTKEYYAEKNNLINSYKRQIESNRDQLQAQIHTISLLVAEKSELQSQVAHNQKLSNQRYQEVEDLTNKLKLSRQKVGDLEKVLSEIKLANEKSEEAKRDMSRQLEQTRNTLKKLKSEKDDLLSEGSQLRSKLMSKTQEISNLELTLDDIKAELEMSQVQIQHLTNNQEGHYDTLFSQLKETDKKNSELIKELDLSKLQFQQLESQNNRLQTQYRSYFENMEERLKNSQSEVLNVTEENNKLLFQLELLNNHKTEDEIPEVSDSHYKQIINDLEIERSSILKKIETLECSKISLDEKNASLLNNNENLVKIIEELEEKNVNLLEKNKQFELNKMDYTQLLSQLQSDKTALSRALAQNKQLKLQLVELQEAFVKLSSDNMDYSTQLQHEKHVSKELALRLGEQEDELNEMRQMLSKKDDEISKLINSNQQITEELLTLNNESNSTLRSQSHFNMTNKVVIENLQNDLLNSQERINQLTTENNHLIQVINKKEELITKADRKENDNDRNLILTLRQMEAERDELLAKCESLHLKENDALRKLKESRYENGSIVTIEEYQSLQSVNEQISKELQNLTLKNTSLLKENQCLEHLVEQLEGETDTIAEYISLYQNQRSLLKQKCAVRDQFMSKLVHHKQLIESKLLLLENLLKTIIKTDDNELIEINDSSRCNEDSALVENSSKTKLTVYDQILNLIHELKKPGDFLTQSFEHSFNKEEKLNSNPSFINPFLSDDLLHYQIIHCKCCVGKVIDL